jgi:NADH-quinone oxidoreductase subunit D
LTQALTLVSLCFQFREKVYEIYEEICGARLTTNMGRIGGFERDWSPEAFRKLDVFFRRISSSLERIQFI